MCIARHFFQHRFIQLPLVTRISGVHPGSIGFDPNFLVFALGRLVVTRFGWFISRNSSEKLYLNKHSRMGQLRLRLKEMSIYMIQCWKEEYINQEKKPSKVSSSRK